MATLVLTVLGDDRPGIVDSLSGLVSHHGGSWERSRMARLGGKFAGIVEVTVPDGRAAALQDALRSLTADGLAHVTAERTDAPAAPGGHRCTLELVGTDQPGLVHAVSAALAAVGANIEELATTTRDAPMAAELLFEATATVVLPPSVPIAQLRAELEALAAHLMVDIELTD
jgi:glycine cleavage system regulatory protein